jgi:hypothetical protein
VLLVNDKPGVLLKRAADATKLQEGLGVACGDS